MAIKNLSIKIIGFLCGLHFISTVSLAQAETANAEALKKTQDLLRDPKQREKAAEEDTKAAATMKSVESFSGKEHSQEIYNLSAEVMGTITNRSKGDVNSMKQDTQKTPEEFIKLLTPEQWAKIEALAKKIEAERAPSSSTTPPK